MHHLQVLKEWLGGLDDNGVEIALQGGGAFTASPAKRENEIIGVNVTNLGDQRFLAIDAFVAALSLLYRSPNHQARKGNALSAPLGDPGMEMDTIEGHVAQVVYGTLVGEHAFKRITPISRILEAAGICENGRGYLRLLLDPVA